MLAPEFWEDTDGGGPYRFMRKPSGELELHLYLKWTCDERNFLKPEHLVKDLERILEKMSKRITYGEVTELREMHEAQSKVVMDLRRRVDELQKFKDAYDLMKSIPK